MADPLPAEEETPTQLQSRLRREKRQKKLSEQGSDRLAKIKALNGGVAPPDEVLGGPVIPPSPPPPAAGSMRGVSGVVDDDVENEDDDPEEVDISSQKFGGRSTRTRTSGMQMQQMQGFGDYGGGGEDQDLIARMMQQMMGQMGGQQQQPMDPNDPNASRQQELPPMLQALMGGGGAGQQQPTASGTAYLWRIVHAIFSFLLAFYICLTSTFNGTQLSRTTTSQLDASSSYGLGPRLFIIFTTSELVLQSTRYFLERGQLQGGGILATIANSGFVPEPYAHYVRVLGRYIGIAKTVFSDVMVVVFVLGCMAWWRGESA